MPTARKLLSEAAAVRLAQRLRRAGKKLVTYNGSFDVLHAGHVRSIEEARTQGDVLLILLNSDRSVRLYKGPTRPMVGEQDRAALLAALEAVDSVVLFDEINPKRLLAKLKPAVHCNGADWGRGCVEQAVVEENGGRLHVLRWRPGHSTTDLISRITKAQTSPVVRAVFLDRDGTINADGTHTPYQADHIRFLPTVISALRRLSKTDYKIIIVTNQSGVGRGYYTDRHVQRLHAWLTQTLAARGVRIDAAYYCPHHPHDGCLCRKPEIGMLLRAVEDFGVSLAKSWFIGDDARDVSAGRESNVQTIKLGARLPQSNLQPTAYARNLRDAVSLILQRSP